MSILESRFDSRRALLAVELLYLIKKGYNTGYDLKKGYNEYFGISVSFGTIYPLLYVLHKRGYLTRKRENKRGQKLYALSYGGRSMLNSNALFLQKFSQALKTV
jgi:DNA-binding PadR family transcriptional regulator